MEEHPYRTAGLVGAGVAAAAWIASRLARRMLDQRERPALPPYRPPAAPGTPAPRPVTPPARPVVPRPPVTPPITADRRAEANGRVALATAMAQTMAQPVAAQAAEITTLASDLAASLSRLALPREDFTATTIRLWRQMESESQRSWPAMDVARRAGDLVWESVFLEQPKADGDPIRLAAWTQKRQTTLATNERIGTDEILVRATAAHAAVRKDVPNPFAAVVELWRRGVVPDITANEVVVRHNGIVVASAPRTPGSTQKGVA